MYKGELYTILKDEHASRNSCVTKALSIECGPYVTLLTIAKCHTHNSSLSKTQCSCHIRRANLYFNYGMKSGEDE